MYNNPPCIAVLIVLFSVQNGFCVSHRVESATILIELNSVAFETTVLTRCTVVCVLSGKMVISIDFYHFARLKRT